MTDLFSVDRGLIVFDGDELKSVCIVMHETGGYMSLPCGENQAQAICDILNQPQHIEALTE